MDINEFQTLTGITVPASKQILYTAQIARSQRILENMLGFTLDPDLYDSNAYTESGKTSTECPCPSESYTLLPADAVVFAYRQFPYNKADKYFAIDPCSDVHAVKLVKDNVTYKTFEADEYRMVNEGGIIRFLEKLECCFNICSDCDGLQLAVDATWLWEDTSHIPLDLQDVWTDMVTFYSNSKSDIKSESLGSHTYTKFDSSKERPELKNENMEIIKKYAGALGSIKRTITL